MAIREKITLGKKGEEISIPTIKNLKCIMTWKASVDLDLYAIYEPKKVIINSSIELNLLDRIIKWFIFLFTIEGNEPQGGYVYFGSKGYLNKYPFIALDMGGKQQGNFNYCPARST